MRELHRSKSWPGDYEVKMFGGGDQFPGKIKAGHLSIPDNNIRFGHTLLKLHGFKLKAEHLGGTGHRNVIFDIWSGHAWIQHVAK